MQITKTFFAALLAATTVVAAPAPVEVSERAPAAVEITERANAAATEWVIENMKRSCDKGDKTCTWNFAIKTNSGKPTSCTMVAKAHGNTKASRANGGPAKCGPFTVTSGWSGKYEEGFTTLAVVDHSKKLIIWPAYRDGVLQNGKVVKPNVHQKPTKF